MKRIPTLFLQLVVLLIGLIALIILIRFPMSEGRAQNLDLFHVYADPLILYAYASSLAFFVALYKTFQILGYIRENKLFTVNSVKALKSIRVCAILLCVLIAAAGVYIKLFHHPDDDPAGFLSMCIILIFIGIAVITAVAVLEKVLQNVIDMKNENDLTI